MGTSYNALDVAEDRGRFSELLKKIIFLIQNLQLLKLLKKQLKFQKH